MGQFEGKTAIVTGGTKGIGRAVCESLLAEGARVTAIYSSGEAGARAFAEANAAHGERLAIEKLDVSGYAACEEFFARFEKTHDGLDFLVNSAGIRRDAVVGMMKEEDWRAVLDINLTGTFNMSKLAVKMMMRRRWGRIVTVTSPIGRIGFPGQANYAASKAGQVGLTLSLAKEVASRRITVNCVSPGFIDTDFIAGLPDKLKEQYRAQVPLGRFGRAEEVANLVAFLLSDKAEYITGAVYEITGGL